MSLLLHSVVFLLLPATGGILWLHQAQLAATAGEDSPLRTGFLHAVIIMGTVLFGLTEGLGLFQALAFPGIAIGWLIILALAGALLAWHLHLHGWRRVLLFPDPEPTGWKWLAAGVGVLLTSTLIMLVLMPPCLGDVLDYHLPRVMQMMQNHHAGFFPTEDLRQLVLSPWAEYAMLHVLVLSGTDRLSALPQWIAFAGSILAASLVVKELGGNRRAQQLSMIFAASAPIAVSQAVTQKNDLIMAFWLLCSLWSLLRFLNRSQPRWIDGVYGGLSLGLACATKDSAPLLGFALLAGLPLFHLWRQRSQWRNVIIFWATVGGLALLFVLPQSYRKIVLFDGVNGLTVANRHFGVFNTVFGVKPVLSNGIRLLAVNLQTPLPAVNRKIEEAVQSLHRRLGMDANDPRTTAFPPFVLYKAPTSTSMMLVFFLATGLSFRSGFWGDRRWRLARQTAGLWGITLLTVLIVLKWDGCYLRYLHFLTLLGGVLSGLVLSTWADSPPWRAASVAWFCLAFAFWTIPFSVSSCIGKSNIQAGRWWNRNEYRLIAGQQEAIYQDCRSVTRQVHALAPRQAGALLQGTPFEYLLWKAWQEEDCAQTVLIPTFWRNDDCNPSWKLSPAAPLATAPEFVVYLLGSYNPEPHPERFPEYQPVFKTSSAWLLRRINRGGHE